MKLREIFRFEVACQLRRPWPWLAFGVLLVFAYVNAREGFMPVTLPQDFILNSPFIITSVTVISCTIWLLVAPAIAGDAGARDVQTGMHPLVYTSPISRFEYIGGRFLAAVVLNALVLLGVQAGSVLAISVPGVAPEIIGPFRPGAYLRAYAFVALPNAVIATAIQFTFALLSGRAMASYLGSLLLLVLAYPVSLIVYFPLGQPGLARLIDPIGVIAIMNEMMLRWTLVEKNVRAFTLEGPILGNRLLWLAVSLTVLAVVHRRFRFAHRVAMALPWARLGGRRSRPAMDPGAPSVVAGQEIVVPGARRTFDLRTRLAQTAAIARSSFGFVAKNPAGLFLLVVFPLFLVLVLVVELQHWDVPITPRTGYMLTKYLTGSWISPENYWAVVPLLLIYFTGELVWRERDARLSETVDATSVPEWALYLGRFAGLGLLLALLMAEVALAGLVAQLISGYTEFQPGLFLTVLFGFQLTDYLLFTALMFLVHAVVNQKYVSQILALVLYILLVMAPTAGVEHSLLVYGAGPSWTWSDIRGFGASVQPLLWFRLYWAAWALLLVIATIVFWIRGTDTGAGARMRLARLRLAGATARAAAIAVVLILALGGFIFYNTNVLNTYRTGAEATHLSAEYERRYGRYADALQPRITATKVNVEIWPRRGAASFSGTYTLVNEHDLPIDSLHIEPAAGVETSVRIGRPARRAIADRELHHDIYVLDQPLAPGDSLELAFEVHYARRGFTGKGASAAVVPNGTCFTGHALPAIGYHAERELTSPDDRRKEGLPRKVTFPSPDDVDPAVARSGGTFEAVVATDAGQVAVAPGVLRRAWTEGDRRYFHYASETPISGLHLFFSSDYAVHRERWGDVEFSIHHDPDHSPAVGRVVRAARASMDYYSSNFGPYPFRFLQFVEQPVSGLGMGVDGSGVVTMLEGSLLLAPEGEGLDVIGEITAHEVAHQWWGAQLRYVPAEGAIVLSESLAWYSALQVIRKEKGAAALRRFMRQMREPYPWPPIRTGLPLLRAMDPWAGYRKGPFAMFALSEYVGEVPVNAALANLLRQHRLDPARGATTSDLYRELQAVTPDSLRPLLHDLFEVDVYWTFDTKGATAKPAGPGTWEVTFDIEARKILADSAGAETEVPVEEWVELGVFTDAGPGEELGRPIYMEKHRLRSGRQSITVVVQGLPARGGIDPNGLLDWEAGDNIEAIEAGQQSAPPS